MKDTDITKYSAHQDLVDLRDELMIVLNHEEPVMGIYALLELAAIRSLDQGIDKETALKAFNRIFEAWEG